jgi:hypothetical protein
MKHTNIIFQFNFDGCLFQELSNSPGWLGRFLRCYSSNDKILLIIAAASVEVGICTLVLLQLDYHGEIFDCLLYWTLVTF